MYSPENDNDINTVGKRSIPPSDQITNSQEQDADGEHSDIDEEKDTDLELKIDRNKNGHDKKTDDTIDVGSGDKSSNRDETSDSESESVASGEAQQNTTCDESLSEDDNEKDGSSISRPYLPELDAETQSPNKASQKSDDSEDAEKYVRCLVCGPAKDTSNKEYTKLSSCPDIGKEIHDLLKILSPPDDMDVCCDRCLGFMKIFITLKNDFLNMRRKIIALHIDAQLELPENDKYDESEAEGVDNDVSDTEDRRRKSKKLDQHSDVIIKHEIIDVDFEEDRDSTKEDKRRVKGRVSRRRKIFKCRHCNKSYTRRYDLKIHQRIHTGERPVKCQYCDRSFHSKNICLQHEKKHMEKPFMCKTCFRYFSTKEECEEHETTHTAPRPFNCQYCNRTFERKNEWLVHERTHTGERPFKCERCEKSFFSKSARLKHEKAKHKDLITARKRTSETKKYDYIEITDSEKVTYKCAHCDRTFTRKDAIILHERTHTGERPFKCKYCSKSFCGKSSCIKHEREKHRGMVSNKENGAETNMDDNSQEKQVYLDGRLKCERCDKSFNKKGDLFEHDKVHEFKCSHCGKSCWGKKALYKHERIHSGGKPHKCKTCDKSFAYKASLEEHERIHTGEKPFLCQYCTRSFTQSSTLKLHERTQHTGEKPYKCRYCEQGFPTRLACEEHERFHTGEKPFKCDFCDKRFVRKSNWRDHVKTHLGLKPQVCSYCGKGFRDRSTLGRHERTHTGERPYRCQYCDKTFVRKNYCNIHEKTHTGEKPVKNQQSNNKLKSPTRTHKSPPQPDFTRKVDHTESSSWGHPSNNTSYVRHQVENAYGAHGQHSNSTFMTGPPESTFRTGPPDNTYRPPNTEISYRGPHSNNVFPTPEAVYPGDNTNPYMYSMYMPGM